MKHTLPENRSSFRPHIVEIRFAADLLSSAADAHLAGDSVTADSLIRQADMTSLREWLDSVWGRGGAHIHSRVVPGEPPAITREGRIQQRMPSSAEKRALIERDGHHCRLCGMPLIRAEVRKRLHDFYPAALPWGSTNATQHAAFQVFWLQYDHLIPHARGGTNLPENMLVACAACNFGRMNFTLAEVGFAPLDTIPMTRSSWDGLERVLPASMRLARGS